MLILNNANLHDYQLQNAKFHVTGTAPSAEKGQVYLDTNDNFLKYHNGSAWVSVKSDYVSVGDNISVFNNNSGYLTSFTETDPIFLASPAGGITSITIDNWNNAFSWGDHALAGYLTSYSGTDQLSDVTARGATTLDTITVGGITAAGQINTSNPFVILNSATTGAATVSAGIVVERGTDLNRVLRWNENTNVWEIQKDDNLYYEISTGSGGTQAYRETITDTQLVTHSFNTRDVSVSMYDSVTFERYVASWTATTLAAITVTFYTTPTNPIRVIITNQS